MDNKPGVWWILALFMGGLFGLAGRMVDGWLRYAFWLIAGLLGTYGGFEFISWVMYSIGDAVQRIGEARVAGPVMMAQAIQSLNHRQLELIANHQIPVYEIVAGNIGPAYLLVTMRSRVPYDVVQEYFEAAQETFPFVLAVRNSKHETAWSDITDLIVSMGDAERAIGNRPAKLTKPLEQVAYEFGVDLSVQ